MPLTNKELITLLSDLLSSGTVPTNYVQAIRDTQERLDEATDLLATAFQDEHRYIHGNEFDADMWLYRKMERLLQVSGINVKALKEDFDAD